MVDNPVVPETNITVLDPNLAHDLKRGCSVCGGDVFAIEDITSNTGAKGTEGLWLQCVGCGNTELIDFEAMGASADYS